MSTIYARCGEREREGERVSKKEKLSRRRRKRGWVLDEPYYKNRKKKHCLRLRIVDLGIYELYSSR